MWNILLRRNLWMGSKLQKVVSRWLSNGYRNWINSSKLKKKILFIKLFYAWWIAKSFSWLLSTNRITFKGLRISIHRWFYVVKAIKNAIRSGTVNNPEFGLTRFFKAFRISSTDFKCWKPTKCRVLFLWDFNVKFESIAISSSLIFVLESFK